MLASARVQERVRDEPSGIRAQEQVQPHKATVLVHKVQVLLRVREQPQEQVPVQEQVRARERELLRKARVLQQVQVRALRAANRTGAEASVRRVEVHKASVRKVEVHKASACKVEALRADKAAPCKAWDAVVQAQDAYLSFV